MRPFPVAPPTSWGNKLSKREHPRFSDGQTKAQSYSSKVAWIASWPTTYLQSSTFSSPPHCACQHRARCLQPHQEGRSPTLFFFGLVGSNKVWQVKDLHLCVSCLVLSPAQFLWLTFPCSDGAVIPFMIVMF